VNKYIAEFIGTFFLVLTGGCSVLGGASIPPLAIGAVLMVMVYAAGHVSGGHLNPAVTLGVFLRGRCSKADVIPYWIAQIVGGIVAAIATRYLLPKVTLPTPGPILVGPAFLAEFLFTFALVYVVLNSATAKGTQGNSFYGLAIGFTVLAGAFAVGPISGGAFNPAVAVGGSILGLFAWPKLWLYVVADLAGAAVAAVAFKTLNPTDK
jgi:aquaporin Z